MPGTVLNKHWEHSVEASTASAVWSSGKSRSGSYPTVDWALVTGIQGAEAAAGGGPRPALRRSVSGR